MPVLCDRIGLRPSSDTATSRLEVKSTNLPTSRNAVIDISGPRETNSHIISAKSNTLRDDVTELSSDFGWLSFVCTGYDQSLE